MKLATNSLIYTV